MIEAAIKHFESYLDNKCYADKFRKYCRLAIVALREQQYQMQEAQYPNLQTQERQSPAYTQWEVLDCDSGEPNGYPPFMEVRCPNCGLEIGIESGQYGWSYGDPFPWTYCPICGSQNN